jgi:Dual specificity phosphatase, catalytic domain
MTGADEWICFGIVAASHPVKRLLYLSTAMSLIFQSPDHSVNGKRPGIYLGGKVDAKNRQKLIDRGITHILNMTPAKEVSIQAGVPNYFERDFVYKRIPVYDSATSVTALRDGADDICQFISTALCHGSILVHCQRGVSRSVAAILLYLVRYVSTCIHTIELEIAWTGWSLPCYFALTCGQL